MDVMEKTNKTETVSLDFKKGSRKKIEHMWNYVRPQKKVPLKGNGWNLGKTQKKCKTQKGIFWNFMEFFEICWKILEDERIEKGKKKWNYEVGDQKKVSPGAK